MILMSYCLIFKTSIIHLIKTRINHGKISILEAGENSELLTLIGFFIGFYFLRRRGAAAAIGLGIAIA